MSVCERSGAGAVWRRGCALFRLSLSVGVSCLCVLVGTTWLMCSCKYTVKGVTGGKVDRVPKLGGVCVYGLEPWGLASLTTMWQSNLKRGVFVMEAGHQMC